MGISMTRTLPIIAAFVLLIACGFVHGLWTERWGRSRELLDAAARVEQVPMEIGFWKGRAEEVDKESFERAGADAYWSRTYRYGQSKDKAVTVILMCGRGGRMSIHTPEVCYRGIGFEVKSAAVPYALNVAEQTKATFWSARFVRDEGAYAELRLFWAWNDGTTWQAPSSPRWHFRGAPYLYKLYLVREIASGSTDLADDPAVEFLHQLLPALQRILLHSQNP